MPLRLQTCTEDRNGMDIGAAIEYHGSCERSTKSCQFLCIEKGVGNPGRGEKR